MGRAGPAEENSRGVRWASCRSLAGFKPRERAILFLEPKTPDFRFGDAWQELEKPAIAHHGNAIDPLVMFGDELEVREKHVKASPPRKRLRIDHDAHEFPPTRNNWIDLGRRLLNGR